MNLTPYKSKAYKNKSNRTLGQNKPNSNPIKPNSLNVQIYINIYDAKDYRKKDDFAVRKNKPNSNPISEKPKMNANLYIARDYENETTSRPKKTNPKQSQSPKGQNEQKPEKLT